MIHTPFASRRSQDLFRDHILIYSHSVLRIAATWITGLLEGWSAAKLHMYKGVDYYGIKVIINHIYLIADFWMYLIRKWIPGIAHPENPHLGLHI